MENESESDGLGQGWKIRVKVTGWGRVENESENYWLGEGWKMRVKVTGWGKGGK